MILDFYIFAVPNAKVGRLAQGTVSFLLVAMIIGLVIIALYLYFVSYLPFLLPGQTSPVGILLTIFALWLWMNTVYNYYQAITLDAGTYSKESSKDSNVETPSKSCAYCLQQKPEHVHHGKHCKRCISMFDHHCPYTANCVGATNYVYFYLFVVYIWLGTCFAALMTLAPFVVCTLPLFSNIDTPWPLRCTKLGHLTLMFIPIFSSVCGTTTLALFQTLLLTHGMTTLEWWTHLKNGEYDRVFAILKFPRKVFQNETPENRKFNFLMLSHGRRWWDLLLPTPPHQKIT